MFKIKCKQLTNQISSSGDTERATGLFEGMPELTLETIKKLVEAYMLSKLDTENFECKFQYSTNFHDNIFVTIIMTHKKSGFNSYHIFGLQKDFCYRSAEVLMEDTKAVLKECNNILNSYEILKDVIDRIVYHPDTKTAIYKDNKLYINKALFSGDTDIAQDVKKFFSVVGEQPASRDISIMLLAGRFIIDYIRFNSIVYMHLGTCVYDSSTLKKVTDRKLIAKIKAKLAIIS